MRRTAAVLTAVLALLAPATPAAVPAPAPTDHVVPATAPAAPGLPDVGDAADRRTGGSAAAEPTMVLRDVYLARPGLDRTGRRAADAVLARPTTPGKDAYASYDPALPPAQRCAARVCVTFVESGPDRATPEWAERTLATFESVWTRQVDEMGYRAPAPDGTAGGDARFDVYLANISAQGFYGYCVPEERVPGHPGRAQSYCVLDNDMAGFARSPAASLEVTAAHEFFHAIQFNLDVREDLWWMEASATWMEEQVADGIDDNRQFLRSGQLGRPGTPLDSFSSDLAAYGNWIFVQRLAQRFGVDAVRGVWERLEASSGAPDEYSVQGLRSYVSSRGEQWGRFYLRFVEGNLTPRRAYPEGRSYPKAPLGTRARVRTGRPTRLSVRVPHLAAHTVQLRAAADLPKRRRLRVRVVTGRPRPAAPAASLLVFRRGGGVARLEVRLNGKGVGSRVVDLRRARVRRVVLVLANASTRYRGCDRSGAWACGGTPVDDRQRFRVVARAIR
ncbi:MXAN_6640 family putative metalloprotease [Nocardioides solisilvae]|uniref:MXAN_6640 family putative metalloprotease n=1 Tax=Nocardioides solisilvae TaxID=1542435 RepID=UPI0013A55E1D|nr:MXAN_6640 family putative metalloprotease [Nocardioides solisilvae]